MDIIGVAETHLLNNVELEFEHFKWFGHNRQNIHINARTGSGGVGFMVRNSVLCDFNVNVADKSHEGILWLKFVHKYTNKNFFACVCYLPPDMSTRAVDVDNYFDTLSTQIFTFQQESEFFICGDFNARTADLEDYIPGIDVVPERKNIDQKVNKYGEIFCEFLTAVNCCILNGRISDVDDYTCVSSSGVSVVDYCVVPYEQLGNFSDFQVRRASELVDTADCKSLIGPGSRVPDHSFISWNYSIDEGLESRIGITAQHSSLNTKKYDLNLVNSDFMSDCAGLKELRDHLTDLNTTDCTQNMVDEIFNSLVSTLQAEMDARLNVKTFEIGNRNKKRKIRKPWWNDHLTELWNKMCTREREMGKINGCAKQRIRHDFVQARKEFDRNVQKAKRNYWFQQQNFLENLECNDQKSLWKEIGKIGVGVERKKAIPMEVVTEDGSVSADINVVLYKWKNVFCDLLNANGVSSVKSSVKLCENNPLPVPENGMYDVDSFNREISFDEIVSALKSAKCGKAVGCDEIPTEVLKNQSVANVLFLLFNICFKKGIIPELWKKGIINPICKSSTKDPRDPTGYRGITLAPAAYKIYCNVLNNRLSEWVNDNDLLSDKQNGFRKGRSTVDHISTLTSIIETRKLQKKSSFVAL